MSDRGAEWVLDTVRFTVYSKAYVKQGFLGEPSSFHADVRCNQVGTLEVTIPNDPGPTSMWTALSQPGARIVFDHADLTSLPAMSGRRTATDDGDEDGTTRFTITDDLIVLFNLRGWPSPASPLDAQTAPYYLDSGPAEKVLKDLVSANLANYPDLKLTVAPLHTPPLGDDIDLASVGGIRFDRIGDQLLPLLDQAGVRAVIYQQDDERILEVLPCPTFPILLTDDGPIVTSYRYTSQDATNTDVIGGDSGTSGGRAFHATADDARAALIGERIVEFVDASSSDTPDALLMAISRKNAAGAPIEQADMTLAETGDFRFGDSLPVGSRVQMKLGPHPEFTEIIRGVSIDLTDQGLEVVPMVIGPGDDDPVVAALADALGRVDRLERS